MNMGHAPWSFRAAKTRLRFDTDDDNHKAILKPNVVVDGMVVDIYICW
jgi:hypothetical protein